MSLRWSFIKKNVVKRRWYMSLRWSFIKSVVKIGWSVTRVVFIKKLCEKRVVCHSGGLSSKRCVKKGWSVTRVVFYHELCNICEWEILQLLPQSETCNSSLFDTTVTLLQ